MEIRKINSNTPSFTNSGKIGLGLKTASKICSIQEGGAGLSHIKFIQDCATCLLPKVVFHSWNLLSLF